MDEPTLLASIGGAREESEPEASCEGEWPVGEIVAREDQAHLKFAMQ
jgi:hypothetical protein